jgi:hypothetical protein
MRDYPTLQPAVENQKIKCNEPMGYTHLYHMSLERGMTGLSE